MIESRKEDEDEEYMLLQPTHYMLDHPMYQEEKKEEKEVEEDRGSLCMFSNIKISNFYF